MYQSLYRKYRPTTINDVVGQSIALKIIKNSLKNNKIGHAYLFSGPRGTGKTTMAKILAKSVNCLNLIDGISCEKCKNCVEINSNETVDIIEIDAASNNGVDEIREIRNSVSLSCSSLKYKIYIVDEVHMLTIGAFNALLKTLEEPPEHIIFILATTDVQKVPSTIISRCQCINFESISAINIKRRLQEISEKEGIKIEDNILMKIAEISNGGLRDAIGNLEKLIAASDEKMITLDIFNSTFGFADDILLNEFFNTIIENNINGMLSLSDTLYNSGKNYIIFVNEMITFVRNKIRIFYEKNNGICPYCDLVFQLDKLCNQLKNTDNIKALFEAGIINIICHFNDSIDNNQVIIQEKKENNSNHLIDKKIFHEQEVKKNSEKEKNFSSKKENSVLIENNEIIMNNTFALANKHDLQKIKEKWNKLNEYLLDQKNGSIACYLFDGNIRACGKNNIILSYEYDSMVNRGFDIYDSLIEFLNEVFNERYYLSLITDEQWKTAKDQYIQNVKNHVEYKIKELKTSETKIDTKQTQNFETMDEASLLFGEDIVEIK